MYSSCACIARCDIIAPERQNRCQLALTAVWGKTGGLPGALTSKFMIAFEWRFVNFLRRKDASTLWHFQVLLSRQRGRGPAADVNVAAQPVDTGSIAATRH